ncbi:hypothetical protein EV182_006417, partial [Spiromyces aspiralis]
NRRKVRHTYKHMSEITRPPSREGSSSSAVVAGDDGSDRAEAVRHFVEQNPASEYIITKSPPQICRQTNDDSANEQQP